MNTRIVRKLETDFGKQEFGVSGAIAQLHNKVTDKDGKYYAVGLHTENNTIVLIYKVRSFTINTMRKIRMV